MDRRSLLAALCALPLCALPRSPRGAPATRDPALRFGVLPYQTATFLLRYYEPLREHMEAELGQTVRLETSPSVATFLRDMIAMRFDLVLTAAHYARVAQLDLGWTPVAQYLQDNEVLIMTPLAAGIDQAAQLRGKRLAVPNLSMLQTLATERWLAGRGLNAGRDIELLDAHGHGAALTALLSGKAEAAVTTLAGLGAFKQSDLDRLAVLASIGTIPHLVIAVRPGTDAAPLSRRVRDAALRAPAPAGSGGFVAATEPRMKRVDPYLGPTREHMGLPVRKRKS